MYYCVRWLRLALSKGPNGAGVSLPSPEDKNRSSFRNVVLSNYLEFQTFGKVQKRGEFECYAPPSEPPRLQFDISNRPVPESVI
jgi:hypothetical protein